MEEQLGVRIMAHLVAGAMPCRMVFGEYDKDTFNQVMTPKPAFQAICGSAMAMQYHRTTRQSSVSLLTLLLLV